MAKFKEFFLKHRMLIGLFIISVLLFLTQIFKPVEWVSAVVIFAFAISCSVSEIFCFNLFLMAFSGVGFQFVVGIGSCVFSLLVKYVIMVVKKQKNIYKLPLAVSVVLLLVFSLYNYGINKEGVEIGLMFIYVIVLIYFVFVFKNEIDISKCFNYLLLGFVISIILSIASLPIDSFKKELYFDDNIYKRFNLFTHHMNNLSIQSMFMLSYAIYSLINRKRKLWIDVVSIVVALSLGISTMSKAFFLITCLMLVYVAVVLIVKFKTKSLIYVCGLFGVVAIALIVGWKYVQIIIDRFFLYFKEGSMLNMFTTGRVDIWKCYLNEWRSTPAKILFGVGLFTKQPMVSSAHNVFIFLLHRFGLVGFALLILLIATYIKNSNSKLKIHLFNVLLFVLWFVIALEENVLSDQFAIYLLFGIMLMFKPKNDEKDIHLPEKREVTLVDNNEKIEDNKIVKKRKVTTKT